MRSISLTAGRFLLWVEYVNYFLHPHGDFAMKLSSGADISFVIAVFGGGSVLSPNFALQCSGIATLAPPHRMTRFIGRQE